MHRLFCDEPGQPAKALQIVRNASEISGALSEALPCLLQVGDGEPSSILAWNGKEVVEVVEELVRWSQFQPAAWGLERHAGELPDRSSQESGVVAGTHDHGQEEEEDVYRNWHPPMRVTDFAAHAATAGGESSVCLPPPPLSPGRIIIKSKHQYTLPLYLCHCIRKFPADLTCKQVYVDMFF